MATEDGRLLMSPTMLPAQKWVPVRLGERRLLLKKITMEGSLASGSANPAEEKESSLARGSANPADEKMKQSAMESSLVQRAKSPAAEEKIDMLCSATKKRKAPPSSGKPRCRSGSESNKGTSRDPSEGEKEIEQLFDRGMKKKKKKQEEGRSQAEIASAVEQVMAELKMAAKEDAELNRQHKPAICKLMKLPRLTESLSMTKLKGEFLDLGVLALLKTWLAPLPDGSLPNAAVRTAVLEALSGLGIDLDRCDRREQLKESGVGKVILLLSRSDEETASNRRRAQELVHTWSRPIFGNSARFEDLRRPDAGERTLLCAQKKARAFDRSLEADDLDLSISLRGGGNSKLAGDGASSSTQRASRPEACPLGFAVRPLSKVNPEEVRAQVKLRVRCQHRETISKKLQTLKAMRKKPLQATKLIAKGRSTSSF